MAKSSKIYWAARQRQLNKALQKAEKDLTKRLSAFYSKESAKLDKEIAAYYAELGEDNVVEYRKMLQHMSDADRKLLMERMDDFAKKYPEKAHLMPTRASIYKLDRLEGLQTSTKLHQMEIGAKTEEEVTRHLKQTAARSANAAAETLTGKGGSLYELNSPLVEKIVGTNWANGVSYSERIWKNTEKLADKLNGDIAAGLVRGDSYDKLSKQLMTEMNIRNRSDAERLIYTEGTHVMNEASISVFQEAGFDQYIISPLPDACEYCQEIAEEQNALVERERSGVPISERTAGENFPPFHPWCRCSYEIVVPEREDWVDEQEDKNIFLSMGGTTQEWEDLKELDGIGQRMSGTSTEWDGTTGRTLTKAEKEGLVEYAKERGFKLYNLSKFDGDTTLLKEQIDIMHGYKEAFPRVFQGKRPTIAFSDHIDADTYAITYLNTVAYNKYALRDRAVTEYSMIESNRFVNPTMEGLARHEFGHLVEYTYGSKGLTYAKDAYYNEYGKSLTDEEISAFLRSEFSWYTVPIKQDAITGVRFISYDEITAELFSYSGNHKFVEAFMNLWGKKGLI